MELLLVVASASLAVVILIALVWRSRRERPVDVQGWHRQLRMLRETAQPDKEPVSDDKLIVDVSQRNVRVLSDSAGQESPGEAAEKGDRPESPPAPEMPESADEQETSGAGSPPDGGSARAERSAESGGEGGSGQRGDNDADVDGGGSAGKNSC